MARSTSRRLVENVQVSDAEVAKFYEKNKDACGGATLDQVKAQMKQLVLQQKQQDRWMSTSGRSASGCPSRSPRPG